MKAFRLISVLFAVAIFACGPVFAAPIEASEPVSQLSVFDQPAGIVASVGVGLHAMTIDILAFGLFALVTMLAVLLSFGPARRLVDFTSVFAMRDLSSASPRKPPG